MKPCQRCGQQNVPDARFCQQCGAGFDEIQPGPTGSAVEAGALSEETQLWRAFIGPNADRYLACFRKFSDGTRTRFAFTWHWPAFLLDPFLWFLYRKMYLYAAVYALGPVVSAYVTGDLTVGIVWRVIAGATAHYVYYWHVRDHLAAIRRRAGLDAGATERLVRDLGGVQRYVIWVGVALYALFLAILIEMIRHGAPDGFPPIGDKVRPASVRSAL